MPGERFNIFMDGKLKKKLKKAAVDEEKSASEIISKLVKLYLDDNGWLKNEIKKRENNK